jgi:hypothetical protein
MGLWAECPMYMGQPHCDFVFKITIIKDLSVRMILLPDGPPTTVQTLVWSGQVYYSVEV